MSVTAVDEGQVPEWDLADRLIKARKHAGLEQSELASYLGLSQRAISSFETGRIVPRMAYLRGWAMRCGVPLEWLVTGRVTADPSGGERGFARVGVLAGVAAGALVAAVGRSPVLAGPVALYITYSEGEGAPEFGEGAPECSAHIPDGDLQSVRSLASAA